MQPHQSIIMPSDPSSANFKPHNACDECRARKLKCSGELTGCARCRADRVACRYSPRKQMGRPRKKRTGNELQQQEYEPWPMDNSSQGVEGSYSSGSNMLYGDSHAQSSSASGYPSMAGHAMPSPNLSYGFSNMDLNYANQSSPPLDLPSMSMLPMDMPIDFSNLNFGTLPNLSQDYYPASGANYPYAPSPSQPPSSLPTPPSATSPRSSSEYNCSCLSNLYKALQHLPTHTADPTFPHTLQPLRKGLRTAAALLHCNHCTSNYASALQNSMGSTTLMHMIVVAYAKLLHHIDQRARSSSKIKFRYGETDSESHGGSLDGVTVDLSGAEWRNFARKAVRRELIGDEDDESQSQGQSVMGVLEGLRARQREWHSTRRFAGDAHHQHQHERAARGGKGKADKDSCICVVGMHFEQLIKQAGGLGL